MKQSVTGGTGYLGSAATALIADGRTVRAHARSIASVYRLPADVEPVAGDNGDAAGLRTCIDESDGVVHAAAARATELIQVLAVPKPSWLTAREARAWRGYLRMRDLLDLQIGRDLARTSGLSAADYSVLAALSETENHQLRPIDLAQRLLWSKSRLSHHLDRMAARGLIRRHRHPTNSRAAMVVLTGHGSAAIEQAAPDHIASARGHFIDLLTDEQLDALGDATETIIAHLTGLSEAPLAPTQAYGSERSN